MREVLCRAAGLARPKLALAPDNCPSLRSISAPQLILLGAMDGHGWPWGKKSYFAIAPASQDGFYQCEVNPEVWWSSGQYIYIDILIYYYYDCDYYDDDYYDYYYYIIHYHSILHRTSFWIFLNHIGSRLAAHSPSQEVSFEESDRMLLWLWSLLSLPLPEPTSSRWHTGRFSKARMEILLNKLICWKFSLHPSLSISENLALQEESGYWPATIHYRMGHQFNVNSSKRENTMTDKPLINHQNLGHSGSRQMQNLLVFVVASHQQYLWWLSWVLVKSHLAKWSLYCSMIPCCYCSHHSYHIISHLYYSIIYICIYIYMYTS